MIKNMSNVNYGQLHLKINEILNERNISKNQICKDLDIPRTNFNKYCRDSVSRFDTNFLCKLCWYLNIEIGELVVYNRPHDPSDNNL